MLDAGTFVYMRLASSFWCLPVTGHAVRHTSHKLDGLTHSTERTKAEKPEMAVIARGELWCVPVVENYFERLRKTSQETLRESIFKAGRCNRTVPGDT